MSHELDPIVRIRELQKDKVNFVLENVDLAYVSSLLSTFRFWTWELRLANSFRRAMMADIPTVGEPYRVTYILHFFWTLCFSYWLSWGWIKYNRTPRRVYRPQTGYDSPGQHKLRRSHTLHQGKYPFDDLVSSSSFVALGLLMSGRLSILHHRPLLECCMRRGSDHGSYQ